MLIDGWSYVLTHKSMYGRQGGGKISVHRFGGGDKNVTRDYRGGHVLSASDFRNSTSPAAVYNDHSLSHALRLAFWYIASKV